jgi:DNA-binding CsgD family transcriptional regulator
MYESLMPRENRTNALNRDRRVLAFELMAQGRVAEVRGNYDAAYDRYRASFDLWRELQYDMRAALVAVDLMRLARDPIYDEILDAVLERAPSAWFAPQASPANELLERITPAETLVLGALLGGKSARAIAEDLERSVHTVNNHTRKIFQAFGVTSRSAVLAQCAELGITPKSLDRIR